jgi:hypothetical protein
MIAVLEIKMNVRSSASSSFSIRAFFFGWGWAIKRPLMKTISGWRKTLNLRKGSSEEQSGRRTCQLQRFQFLVQDGRCSAFPKVAR